MHHVRELATQSSSIAIVVTLNVPETSNTQIFYSYLHKERRVRCLSFCMNEQSLMKVTAIESLEVRKGGLPPLKH